MPPQPACQAARKRKSVRLRKRSLRRFPSPREGVRAATDLRIPNTTPTPQGATIPDDLLAHIAPLGWEHIGLTGDYVWSASDRDAPLRPLRDVRTMFPAQVA